MRSEEVKEISLNYLSSKLMEVAGLPKSAIQRMLDEMRPTIPLINGLGFKGDNGQWYAPFQESEYKSILNKYHTAMYFRIFDQWKGSKKG